MKQIVVVFYLILVLDVLATVVGTYANLSMESAGSDGISYPAIIVSAIIGLFVLVYLFYSPFIFSFIKRQASRESLSGLPIALVVILFTLMVVTYNYFTTYLGAKNVFGSSSELLLYGLTSSLSI